MSAPFERARPDDCLSDLRMDQMLAGESAEHDAGRAHLEGCGSCAERFAAIRADRDAFANNAPALELGGDRRRGGWLWAATPVVALAAGVTLVVGLAVGLGGGDEHDPGIRSKGGQRLGFFVRHADAARVGASGEVVAPGDSLRFTYSAAQAGFIAVLSVDGAAQASIYYPTGRGVAAEMVAGQDVALPLSTVLDDTLGRETIYGLFCARPVELEPVRIALQANPAAPPVPAGCVLDRLVITKKAAP